jgi:hypothetical protein
MAKRSRLVHLLVIGVFHASRIIVLFTIASDIQGSGQEKKSDLIVKMMPMKSGNITQAMTDAKELKFDTCI